MPRRTTGFELRNKVLALVKSGSAEGISLTSPRPLGRLPWGGAAPLRDLKLTTTVSGRVDGARFFIGDFERGDPFRTGTMITPVHRLDLELVDKAGHVVQQLTENGGAARLLPGEYGYRLRRQELDRLKPGRYAFRVRVLGLGNKEEKSEIAFTHRASKTKSPRPPRK
jgi:hypothetical protein